MQTNAHFGTEERLYGLRTQRWTPYLTFTLNTIAKAANITLDLLRSIERLYDQTEIALRELGLDSHIAYLPAIFEFPACRTGEISTSAGARRQVASHILNDLARAQVLRRTEDGRDRIFYHTRLIELLSSSQRSFTPFPRGLEPFVPLYQKGTPGRVRREIATDDPLSSAS